MSSHLPRALEFEVLTDEWCQVKVDAHVFIYRASPDGLDILLHRVKRGGRRAHRASEHYETAALEFARREARTRGLIRRSDASLEPE